MKKFQFSDFIGNKGAKAKILLLMHAARSGGNLPHMAFLGPSGVGKTMMANIVAGELERKFIYVNSTAISNPLAFRKLITDPEVILMNQGAVVLLDECHRLPPKIQDNLLSVLEEPAILVTSYKDEIIRDPLPPGMSFIFATTHGGLLRHALTTRLEMVEFENYSVDEKRDIARINLKAAIKQLGLRATHDAAAPLEIAMRSRNGRNIVNNCFNVARFAAQTSKRKITRKVVADCFAILDIDVNGLTRTDHRYLAALQMLGQVGLDTISSFIQVPKKDLQEKVEPWLLQNNLVLVLQRGRVITPKGIVATQKVRCLDNGVDDWLDD